MLQASPGHSQNLRTRCVPGIVADTQEGAPVMPKMAWNAKDIPAKARAIDGKRTIWTFEGARGLTLECLSDGRRLWKCRYRTKAGKTRIERKYELGELAPEARRALGDTEQDHVLTPGQARDKALSILARAKSGEDPWKLERGNTEETHAKETFSDLFTGWLKLHAKPRKRSWEHDEKLYDRHIKERIGQRLAAEITRKEIMGVLEDIIAGGSGTQANKALSLISAVFTWAVKGERVDHHPAVGITKPVPESPRERIWSHDELRRLWHALEAAIAHRPNAAPMSPQLARALKLLLLTALRRGEVVGARRAEFEGTTWIIPSKRMKAKKQHVVTLPPLAAQIIRDAVLESGHPDLIFPGREGADLHPDSLTAAMIRTCKQLGIKGATVHALRRTAASEMGRLQVPPEIIERVLAHTPQGVTMKHYNLHSYAPEKLAALTKWQDELLRIVGQPSPYTSLHRH